MAMAMERRAKRRPSSPSRVAFVKRSRAQAIGTIAVALVVSVLCFQNGFAAFAREDRAQMALTVAPWDARAKSALAGQIQVLRGRGDDPEAVALAKAALRRDATLPTPYRVLGFARDAVSDAAGAERLLAAGNKLSRRDFATQLWLIERAVGRNDVPGALDHYDIALRTSDAAPAILTPILAQGLSEPQIVDGLAPRLKSAPWGPQFLTDAIATSKSMPGLVRLAIRLQQHGHPLSLDNMRQLANRLVEEKAFREVAALRAISPARLPSGQLIGDPTFDRPGDIASFAWALGQGDHAEVVRKSEEGGGIKGIRFTVQPKRTGEVARQLLTLAPGQYRLAIAGRSNVRSDNMPPTWFLTCADTLTQLATLDMPNSAPTKLTEVQFDVPRGCNAQSLVLAVRRTEVAAVVEGSVDQVAIFRR
jgi:hypothetical protein